MELKERQQSWIVDSRREARSNRSALHQCRYSRKVGIRSGMVQHAVRDLVW
jgi:hypothetical protein